MDRKKALEEEDRKIRRLRFLTDFVAQLLSRPETSILEAYGLIQYARREALRMFPGKECTFDLIYQSRFRRILEARLLHQSEFCN